MRAACGGRSAVEAAPRRGWRPHGLALQFGKWSRRGRGGAQPTPRKAHGSHGHGPHGLGRAAGLRRACWRAARGVVRPPAVALA
eukprot:490182-Prymnesium_polylepis.1